MRLGGRQRRERPEVSYWASQNQINRERIVSTVSVDEEYDKATGFNVLGEL